MFPFDIAEIHGALSLAYKIIEIGWSDAHNAHQQYTEFRGDVEMLAENLNNLHLAITISRARTGFAISQTWPAQSMQTSRHLSQIFGRFKETLEECWALLERRSCYGTHHGPAFNIQWFLRVRDDIDLLRNRIATLNIKLSIALKCVEIETSDGNRVLMKEYTDLLLHRIELAESRLSNMILGQSMPTESTRRLDIPKPLHDSLVTISTTRYGSMAALPIVQGVEETIFYLDRATRWHARGESRQRCQAFKLANILRAYWLLQATKEGDEYQAASDNISIEEFERNLPRFGMTTRRFFSQLEEKILEAYDQLARADDRAPPVTRLWEVIEQEKDVWQEHGPLKAQEEEDDNPRRGENVLTCRLQSVNAGERSLEVYQQSGAYEQLTIITCGAGRPDRIHQIDLASMHLRPSPEVVGPSNSFYSVALSPDSNRTENGFKLVFSSKRDLFRFQQVMTGYRVVDDYAGIRLTCQRARRLIGGERKTDTGRVQLWSSTAQYAGPNLPQEFVGSSTVTIRNLPSGTTSSYPPVIPPMDSFSRLTLSQESTRNTSSESSSLFDAQAAQSRSHTPALTRTSTVTSASRSSATSLHAPSIKPRNIIQVDKRGNVGCILDIPDPPRLVMFLGGTQPVASPPQPQSPDYRTASLLVIDIDKHVRINPALCDCRQAQAGAQGQPYLGQQTPNGSLPPVLLLQRQPAAPEPQCRRVVLQGINGSNICARETAAAAPQTATAGAVPESTDRGNAGPAWNWNLAGAGRYQHGEGLVRVKRLKIMTVEFASAEERIRFVAYFNDLKALQEGYGV
ncbi:hypothetical protein MFIFM68171_03040 [Madurella fahalii]|uniref:Uncharacterized protein n=1 Tax=Madurella fahalii TaxID=1157608 RepID=A0ABQ0G4Y7_9PEZI